MGVDVNPAVLEWAIERSGKDRGKLEEVFNLAAWLKKEEQPSLKDLEKLAKKTYTPVGFLCGSIVPDEKLPINDFRLLDNKNKNKLNANLLDLIYECQMRQSWYQWYRENEELGEVSAVGKYTIKQDPAKAAREISKEFGFPQDAKDFGDYVQLIEEQDILVMSSSVVEGNTHRPVELTDARGFALVDKYAPIILVNAKDTSSARKFTLMHELGHIVSGNEGVSNSFVGSDKMKGGSFTVENWCNKFAAEILVPEQDFRNLYESTKGANHFDNLEELSEHFKISKLVIMRRVFDLGFYKGNADSFWQAFNEEKKLAIKTSKLGGSGGGNYYSLVLNRASKKFYKYLMESTLEGKTTYTHAMSLMNTNSISTFNKLANRMGYL